MGEDHGCAAVTGDLDLMQPRGRLQPFEDPLPESGKLFIGMRPDDIAFGVHTEEATGGRVEDGAFTEEACSRTALPPPTVPRAVGTLVQRFPHPDQPLAAPLIAQQHRSVLALERRHHVTRIFDCHPVRQPDNSQPDRPRERAARDHPLRPQGHAHRR